MANSYSQLYVQMVFAVKGRQSLILPENREKILSGRPDMALLVMGSHRLSR